MTFPWPDITPPSLVPAHDAVDRVKALVGVACGLAATGRTVDLTGLELATGRLCAQVLDLPPPQSSALRPSLVDLRDKMGTLTELMAARS